MSTKMKMSSYLAGLLVGIFVSIIYNLNASEEIRDLNHKAIHDALAMCPDELPMRFDVESTEGSWKHYKTIVYCDDGSIITHITP
jgi:hypothetical protein